MSDEIGAIKKEVPNNIGDTPAPGMRTETSTMPSGFEIKFREINGEDEDLISKMGRSMLSSLDQLLAGVIVGPRVYTTEEVAKWKSIDRYYLLLKLRILSHGSEMSFDVQLYDLKGKPSRILNFNENLDKYVTDLSVEVLPKKTFEHRIDKHPGGLSPFRSLTLKSGKEVRYLYANGESEKMGIEVGPTNMSRNDIFNFRKLSQKISGEWMEVVNFKAFTPADTRELKADIEENDVEFGLVTEIVNPDTTVKSFHTLIEYEEFFFPN